MSGGSRVEYVGFLGEGSGYGQAARSHLLALAGAGVPVAARAVLVGPGGIGDVPPDRTRFPEVCRLVRPRRGHGPVVIHTPPDLFPPLRRSARPNIGVSAWEMEELPAGWPAALREVDEVWVPSEFCAAAFRRCTERPVMVVPHPVSAPRPAPRRFPGIPDDVFLFLSIFEWSDRKNPEGLIRAFLDAFDARRDVGLVLKVGLRFRVDAAEIVRRIRRLCRFRAPPVYLILQDEFSTATVDQLYRRADAYVSLHRAEGFGLCMAEAMAAEKPVVATAYSGNLEFMDEGSAFLVGYRLVEARQRLVRNQLFTSRMRWAEPDHDQAVAALRCCFLDGSARERRARAGRDRVRQALDPRRIGALMSARIRRFMA